VDLLDLPEAVATPPQRRLPALSARLPQHLRDKVRQSPATIVQYPPVS
jgi:hypothetical protein